MMEVQNAEDAIFTRDHIQFWEGSFRHDEDTGVNYVILEGGDEKPVNVFAGVDPATDSARRDTDFSVILVVAVDSDNNCYVLDYIRNRSLPVLGIPGDGKKGIVDHLFDYQKIYKPSLFTIEDTAMSKPVFQSLVAEMRRRNDFSVHFKEEKPGNRMSKRDRIQSVLAQRFAIGSMHIRKNHFDLEHEVLTFGPRMAHDDTIDALAYACKYAQPSTNIKASGSTYRYHRPKPKNWVVA